MLSPLAQTNEKPAHPSRRSACTRFPPAAWPRRSSTPPTRRRTCSDAKKSAPSWNKNGCVGHATLGATGPPDRKLPGEQRMPTACGPQRGPQLGESAHRRHGPQHSTAQHSAAQRAHRSTNWSRPRLSVSQSSRFSPGVNTRSPGSSYASGTCTAGTIGRSQLTAVRAMHSNPGATAG